MLLLDGPRHFVISAQSQADGGPSDICKPSILPASKDVLVPMPQSSDVLQGSLGTALLAALLEFPGKSGRQTLLIPIERHEVRLLMLNSKSNKNKIKIV